jgi:replicative DNA helicase
MTTSGQYDRVLDGAAAFLDVPEHVPAVWGSIHDPSKVLMAEGEGLMIAGPTGIGKSTLAQQVALARAGVSKSLDVLGMMVTPDPANRPVLYVGADRPWQIRRSFRRMVQPWQRDLLENGFLFSPGPLPFDVTADPTGLLDMATDLNVGMIVIDSLKDLAPALTKDETGSAINIAFQHVIAAEIELLVLHHTRKQDGERRIRSIDDIYGSTWLTSGMGSVLLLEGEPGDPVVKAKHIKQPAETCGPWELRHDHTTGTTVIANEVDLVALINQSPEGITTTAAASALFKTAKPAPNEIEKARRQLKTITKEGKALEIPGVPPEPSVFVPAGDRGPERGSPTEDTRQPTDSLCTDPRQTHADPHPEGQLAPTPFRGAMAVPVGPLELRLPGVWSEDDVQALKVAFDAEELAA